MKKIKLFNNIKNKIQLKKIKSLKIFKHKNLLMIIIIKLN
jgi:hypothetical protein